MLRVWQYCQRSSSSFYTNLSSQVTIHHQSWIEATKMTRSILKWTDVDQNRLNEWNREPTNIKLKMWYKC